MNDGATALVLGASGYIGTHLVPRLRAEGWRVRAAARDPSALAARGWSGVDIVAADALHPASLSAALAGVDVAFYLVHSMAAGRRFAHVELDAARNFAAATEAAATRRTVYLGGLLPDRPASQHLDSRAATGDLLRAGRTPVTEIRAGMIVGPGSAAFEVIRDIVNHLPIVLSPHAAQSLSTPIGLDNLLAYVVGVATLDAAADQVYDVGGPEDLSYEDLMRQYAAVVGRDCRIVRVPLVTPRVAALGLGLVSSVPGRIARALIEGLAHDVIARDEPIRRLLPLQLFDFRQSVRAALALEQRNATVPHWLEGSIASRRHDARNAFYARKAGASGRTRASAAALWGQLCAFGGHDGYLYADWLWTLRRVLDYLAGGPSFRQPNLGAAERRPGDVLEGWRVIAAEPSRRLTLQMELRAPGAGVLEFTITDLGEEREVSATAYWHPAGPAGQLYWLVLLPAHGFLFRGLVARIAAGAEQSEGDGGSAP